MLLYRIESRSSWNDACTLGVFYGELEQDGFIHLSTLEQVLGVAGALYAGQTDLLLLELDSAHLQTGLVYEDLYGAGENFPHLYGQLETKTVAQVLELRWVEASFVLPLELRVELEN